MSHYLNDLLIFLLTCRKRQWSENSLAAHRNSLVTRTSPSMPRSALLQQLANGLLQARAAASPRVGRGGGGTQGPRAACGFRPAAGRREAGPARLLASQTLWFSFSFSVPELKETWPLGHLRQGSASPGLSLPTPETLAGAGSEAEGGGAVGNGARSPDFWRGATGSPRAVRLRSGVSIHQPLRGGELLPGPSAPRPGRWRGLLLEPQKALEAGATANGAPTTSAVLLLPASVIPDA